MRLVAVLVSVATKKRKEKKRKEKKRQYEQTQLPLAIVGARAELSPKCTYRILQYFIASFGIAILLEE